LKPALIGILKNDENESARKWQAACEKRSIPYRVIDLMGHEWLQQITASPFDLMLLKPPCKLERFKNLYDERIYVLSKVLERKIFPTFEECYLYENKKLLSYFLKAQNIPHPATFIFYRREEARELICNHTLPLVGKSSIGASGSGVAILRNRKAALRYADKAFSKSGIKRRFGPNRVTGTPGKWLKKAIKSPAYFASRMKEYFAIQADGQRGYVILQEYIAHSFEWRAVRIGDSFFAHKKIKQGDKASGTKGIDYVNPPFDLLDFVKDFCDRNNFYCMAVDLFEDGNGGYLINELQTIFGHVQDYILTVDGKPGRYVFKSGQWIFERGDFNTNESFDLRLDTALELYEQGKL
jgi:glutathione synthase/RimK-type ligase-like ATP-grasp enzyme